MTSCTRCDGFTEPININTPREYRDFAEQLIQLVDQGTFLLVHADCPLQDLFGQHWPGDVLIHEFRCSTCQRQFKLAADTYHGNVSWSAL